MNQLIKLEMVAVKHKIQQSQRHVYFQFGTDQDERREGFFMGRPNWDEMGQPEVITITVVPGRSLEAGSNHRYTLKNPPKQEIELNVEVPRSDVGI